MTVKSGAFTVIVGARKVGKRTVTMFYFSPQTLECASWKRFCTRVVENILVSPIRYLVFKLLTDRTAPDNSSHSTSLLSSRQAIVSAQCGVASYPVSDCTGSGPTDRVPGRTPRSCHRGG